MGGARAMVMDPARVGHREPADAQRESAEKAKLPGPGAGSGGSGFAAPSRGMFGASVAPVLGAPTNARARAVPPSAPTGAVGFRFGALPLQAKLTVSEPGDELEQEADRVADRVMRMAVPPDDEGGHPGQGLRGTRTALQRKCATCDEEDRLIRRKAGLSGPPAPSVPSVVTDGLRSSGHPLDAQTRAFMEPRFRRDFGTVRVHTDSVAARSAIAVAARAYTVGNRIVFAPGEYAPKTAVGRRLLAHELAHTVQQGNVPTDSRSGRVTSGNPPLEVATDRAARAFGAGDVIPINGVARGHISFQHRGAPSASPQEEHVAQQPTGGDLPTSQLIEIVLERLEPLVQQLPLLHTLAEALRARNSAAPGADEMQFRRRLERVSDTLPSVETAFVALKTLKRPEQYLDTVAHQIIEHASFIELELGTALRAAFFGVDLQNLILERANAQLAQFPDYITDQYLGPNGIERQIRAIAPLREDLSRFRGLTGRAEITRRADEMIGLGEPLSIRMRGGISQTLQMVLERARSQRAGHAPEFVDTLRNLNEDTRVISTLTAALAAYEQFEFWVQKFNEPVSRVVDLYHSQAPLARQYHASLNRIINEFEALGPASSPDYYTRASAAADHANALLGSPDFDRASTSIAARLGTIENINLIGRVILITAAATLTGELAGEFAGAALGRLGAGTLVRGAGTFAAEVGTFTFASRLGHQALIGAPQTDFITDLEQNALLFGAQRIVGTVFRSVFRVTRDSSLAARAAARFGGAAAGGLTLHAFTEMQYALSHGGAAMGGEERYGAVLNNAVTIVALELGRFIVEPVSTRIQESIRTLFSADLRQRLQTLEPQRNAIRQQIEALRRGQLTEQSRAALLGVIQSVWAEELRVLAEARRRNVISTPEIEASVARYVHELGAAELRLARMGVQAPLREAEAVPLFRPIRLGIVAYREGGVSTLREFYDRPGFQLEAHAGQEGEFVGRTPSGEVTYYVPEERLGVRAEPEAVSVAQERAQHAVGGDELAAAGLARFNQMGFGPRRIAEFLASFSDEGLLVDFLRMVGRDPQSFNHTLGDLYSRISQTPEAIAFGREFGGSVLARLWRNFGRRATFADQLRAAEAWLRDPALSPEQRAERIRQLATDSDTRRVERTIGTAPARPPPPRRPSASTMGVDRGASEWSVLRVEEADLASRRGLVLTETEKDTWADLQQTFSRARRGDFRRARVQYDDLVRILTEYDRRAEAARMPRLVINARRGRIAELFFAPRPFEPQQAYLGGEPVAYSTEGASRPDYPIRPEDAAAQGEPGRTFTEFVDIKSDDLRSGRARLADRAYEAGVSAARQYRADAIADLANLPAGSRISLHFIRNVDPATEIAMLDILFGPESVVFRVRFGRGDWQTNPRYR